MDVARKIKTKVTAGFKMRGLILRPYVLNQIFTLIPDFAALVTLLRESKHGNYVTSTSGNVRDCNCAFSAPFF